MVHVHQKAMYAEYALRVSPEGGERCAATHILNHAVTTASRQAGRSRHITSSVHRFSSKQRDSTLERGYNFFRE